VKIVGNGVGAVWVEAASTALFSKFASAARVLHLRVLSTVRVKPKGSANGIPGTAPASSPCVA